MSTAIETATATQLSAIRGYLGVTAAANLKSKITSIATRHARSKTDNPRTRAVMTTPPALTFTTTAPAYTQQFPAAPANTADLENYIRYTGAGWKVYSGGKCYPRGATVDSTATINRTVTTNSNGTIFGAEFLVDDVTFSVVMNRGNITGGYATVKVIVDGQYVSTAGIAVPDAAFATGYLNFDFTSAGGRAIRHIRIESSSDNGIGSVYTTATGNVIPVQEQKNGPRILVITDSYGINGGPGPAVDSWAMQLGHFIGCPDIVVNSIGGTGWLVPHGTGHDTYLDRINASDVTITAPDIIIIAGGINDSTAIAASTITRANFQARLPVTLAALRTAAPGVPIMVVGPWTPGGANTTTNPQVDDDIASAVTTLADPLMWNVRMVRRSGYNYPTVQTVKPIMWGAGNTGTPAGLGSNDIYGGPDGIHLMTIGHTALARWLAGEFVAGLQAINAAL